MSLFLYNIVVNLYAFSIRIAALGSVKAKQWIDGRKDWRAKLQQQVRQLGTGERIWFHCASYGEFEQGRPLIEEWRRRDPSIKIILTFFSPSGYEAFHNWSGAEIVAYLPKDSKQNATDFLEIVAPSKVVFVKYEFWLHFLFALEKRKIPTYLISATFKPHHPFFKWYGGIFRQSLKCFTWIFLQEKKSLQALADIKVSHASVAGDTRFDRVIEIKKQACAFDGFLEFRGNSFLLMAGSTWPKDEKLLLETFSNLKSENFKLILVPHDLNASVQLESLNKWRAAGFKVSLYSQGIKASDQVLIVDAMGMLSSLYRYADVSYVGGGLDGGLHNTLEPTVYGIPVVFAGAGYEKYNEAVNLLQRGDAELVNDANSFKLHLQRWQSEPSKLAIINKDLSSYFEENSDVSTKILDQILE